jgi:hypothetical protein
MHRDASVRVAALLGLVVLGLGLAGAGAALGVGDPVTDEPALGVAVGEERVTLSDGDREVAVLNDTRGVETIEFRTDGGGFVVDAERPSPLTAADRERAREVVRANATMQRNLEAMGAAELVVEPIVELDTTEADVTAYTVYNVTAVGNESATFRVVEAGGASSSDPAFGGDDSVTLRRDRTYVEDRASVGVRDPTTGEEIYSVTVALTNGTVTRITDWDAVGEES